jgi:hypothetical protein
MINKKTQLLAAAISACLVAGSNASTIITENFDNFIAGNLSGQGGWTGSTGPNVSTTDPGFGMSGNVASYTGVDRWVFSTLGSTFNDTDILVMELDLRITDDLSYTLIGLDSSGVDMGVQYGNLVLKNTAAGALEFDHGLTGANQYHMILTIDPTAYNGAGSAGVTIAQYTDETTLTAATTVFSNVELKLDDAGRALSNGAKVNMRLHGAKAEVIIDNIQFTQVPEPSSTALLGLGGLALILRRRK